jgi:ABC-type uncharacterized transport system auxiliary subunit
VSIYDGHSNPDYILAGRLEKLEEVDYEGGVKVQVEIWAQMTKLDTGATVWSNEVSESGTVSGRDVPAIVSEMNHAMDRAIAKLLTPAPLPAIAKGN